MVHFKTFGSRSRCGLGLIRALALGCVLYLAAPSLARADIIMLEGGETADGSQQGGGSPGNPSIQDGSTSDTTDPKSRRGLLWLLTSMLDDFTSGWDARGASFSMGGIGGVGAGGGRALTPSQAQALVALANRASQLAKQPPDSPQQAQQLLNALTTIQNALAQIDSPSPPIVQASAEVGQAIQDIQNYSSGGAVEDDSAGGAAASAFTALSFNSVEGLSTIAFFQGQPGVPTSDAPEPGAWALMIFGSLLTGLQLRRGRMMRHSQERA